MIPTRDRYESVYYYWPYATQDKLSSLVLGGGKWSGLTPRGAQVTLG
jgi:hypothetical protein